MYVMQNSIIFLCFYLRHGPYLNTCLGVRIYKCILIFHLFNLWMITCHVYQNVHLFLHYIPTNWPLHWNNKKHLQNPAFGLPSTIIQPLLQLLPENQDNDVQVYLRQVCMFTNRSTPPWHVQSPSVIMATVWCYKTELDSADSGEGYGWACTELDRSIAIHLPGQRPVIAALQQRGLS